VALLSTVHPALSLGFGHLLSCLRTSFRACSCLTDTFSCFLRMCASKMRIPLTLLGNAYATDGTESTTKPTGCSAHFTGRTHSPDSIFLMNRRVFAIGCEFSKICRAVIRRVSVLMVNNLTLTNQIIRVDDVPHQVRAQYVALLAGSRMSQRLLRRKQNGYAAFLICREALVKRVGLTTTSFPFQCCYNLGAYFISFCRIVLTKFCQAYALPAFIRESVWVGTRACLTAIFPSWQNRLHAHGAFQLCKPPLLIPGYYSPEAI